MEPSDRPGVWKVSLTFLYGTPSDIPFKFAWLLDGEWVWQYMPGHINHVVLLDDRDSRQTLHLAFRPRTGRIEAVEDPGGSFDNYAQILEKTDSNRPGSEYRYYQAVQLLMNDRAEQAWQVYQDYVTHRPGGSEIDDFYYLWALDLADKGRHSLAMSYLGEADPDSVRTGMTLLQQIAYLEQEEHPHKARQALIVLVRHARTQNDPDRMLAAQRRLAHIGTPEQQSMAEADLLEMKLDWGDPGKVLVRIEELLAGPDITEGLEQSLAEIRVRALHQTGKRQLAAEALDHYRSEFPENRRLKHLHHRLEAAVAPASPPSYLQKN